MFSSLILRDLLDPPSYRYGLFGDRDSSRDPLFGGDYYLNPARVHVNIIRPRPQASSLFGEKANSKPDDQFKVMLNVNHFRPDEIDVKTVDDYVVIHGKHEEHADEHGFVSREFTRRYKIPEDVESEKLTSSLSKDGILTIQAPRKTAPLPQNERIVPVIIQQNAAVEEAKKIHEQQQQQSEGQQQSEQQAGE